MYLVLNICGLYLECKAAKQIKIMGAFTAHYLKILLKTQLSSAQLW